MKRVFSLLLVLLLMVGLVPMQALADGSGPDVTIKIVAGAGHGSVSISPAAPAPGDTVQVTATADTNYELKELHLTGNGVDQYVNTYERSFVMPDVSVTLEVSFGPAGDSETFGATVSYVYYDINNPNQGPLGYGLVENVLPGRYEFVPMTGYTIHHIDTEDATVYDNRYVDVPEFGYISATVWLQTGGGDNGGNGGGQEQPTRYNIIVNEPENGTVTATVNGSPANTATEGEIVTVTGTPAENHYVLSAVAHTDAGNPVADFAMKDEGIFTFTMPDEDVEITVYFQKMTSYKVKVNQPVDGHGTVAATPTEQLMGRPVTVTGTPKDGYRLAGITVTNDTTTKEVSLQADGKTFFMPASDVTVTASFEEIPTYDITVKAPPQVTLNLPPKAEEGKKFTVEPTITGDFIPTITVTGPKGEEVKLDGNQFTMPAYPVTVKVTLDPAVTVTFHFEKNDVAPQKFAIKKGASLSELPEAEWTNHIFMGWYPKNGQKITTQTVFNEDTDVYAHWSTVTYKPTEGITVSGLTDEGMENLLKQAEEEGKLTLGTQYNARFWLEKTEIAAPDSNAQTAIVNKADGDQVAAYLNLQWYVQVDGGEPIAISNDGVNSHVEMELKNVKLPDNLVYDSFYLIHYHNGQAKIIWDTTFDVNSKVLKFEASEFSPYALVCKTYEIKFSPDGGNGTMDSIIIKPGDYVLPENKFDPPSGKEFGGWKFGNEIKQPGDKIRPTADTVITAVWKDKVSTTSAGTLDNVPKTGDSAPLMGWTMLVLCSAAMLAGVALFDKKRAR